MSQKQRKDSVISSYFLSVIIPTRNRRFLLENVLQAFNTQSLKSDFWELIVVDNGSKDGTQETLSIFETKMTNFRWFLEHQVGSNFARNRGLKETRGNLVAFLDDDTIPHPQWLERIYQRYSTMNLSTDCLGGKVALRLPQKLPPWYGPFLENYLSLTDLGPSFKSVSARNVCSANLIFPRNLLKDLGGFDTRMNRKTHDLRSNDETLTLLKLEALGTRFFFDPCVKVFHQIGADRLKKNYFRRRAWWQGWSDSEMECYLSGKEALWKNVVWPSLHHLLTHPSLFFYAFRPCRGPKKFSLALQGQLFLGRIMGGVLKLIKRNEER